MSFNVLNAVLSSVAGNAATQVHYFLRGYLYSNFLDPEIDVVLITGGCSGLGEALVHRLRAKKIPVVVLDVAEPAEAIEGVRYFKVDISARDEVVEVARVIKEEIGEVTVLVNNAAITHGKTLLDLSFEEIEKTIDVNLISHYYTIKLFLPGMLKLQRGYIVTVSSVLGFVGPAKLGAYAASKGGLLCLHDTLTYEVGPSANSSAGIRTLLLATGQLSTTLFHGVRTPSRVYAPVLSPDIVADRLMLALDRGEQGKVTLPTYARFMPLIRMLPRRMSRIVRYWSGIDTGMNSYLSDDADLAGVAVARDGPEPVAPAAPELVVSTADAGSA
ncbi:uncharacterized protein V1510DRAFT_362693 [Dipodascopsis tothii]|uniref:uncharacterized protein n=1 Tax=Dipodascopsis tothii TaxID=44089 RepID=UPI0034CEA284